MITNDISKLINKNNLFNVYIKYVGSIIQIVVKNNNLKMVGCDIIAENAY